MASLRTALLVSLCLLALLGGLPAPVWAVKARPNTRDASVWARGVAKNAKTRLIEGKAVRIFRLATATVLLLPGVGIGLPGTPRRIVFMFVLMLGAFVQHLRTRRPYVRPPLHGQIRTMGTHSFSNETCREFLGYDNLVLLQRALNAWQIPASITVGDNLDPSKNYQMSGELVMLIVLNRKKVDQKLTNMEAFWGASYDTLSRIIKAGEVWFVGAHGHRLLDVTLFVPHFAAYNAAIVAKHNQRFGHLHIQHGGPPPELASTFSFYDRTNVPICRPGPDWFAQALVFNGHAWDHVLGAAAAMAPDGIFIHFYTGVVSGRHSDQHFLNMSGLDAHLTAVQQGQPRQFWLYTDKGYGNFMMNLFSAYHGIGVTVQEHIWNYMMSPLRVTVEWGFGRLKAMFPSLARRVMMKTQLSPTNLYLKSAALMYNTHTMLHGSNIGLYFGLGARVTVEQYFA